MTELTLPPAYPVHMVRCWQLADGAVVTIRPVRPEDGPLEQDFIRSLSPRSRYYRFFNAIRELSPARLERLTHVDYRHQMTLVAVCRTAGMESQVGVAEYVAEDGMDSCEFAVVVHDAWQGRGLGSLLIDSLARCATQAGYRSMEGEVMADNHAMRELARALGFGVRRMAGDARVVKVSKAISPADFHLSSPVSARTAPCAD